MNLTNEISNYKAGFIEKVPSDIREIMANATDALSKTGLVQSAPKKVTSF